MQKIKILQTLYLCLFLTNIYCTNDICIKSCVVKSNTKDKFTKKYSSLSNNFYKLVKNPLSQNKNNILLLLWSYFFYTGKCSYVNENKGDKNTKGCCLSKNKYNEVVKGLSIENSNEKYNPLLFYKNYNLKHNSPNDYLLQDIMLLNDNSVLTLGNIKINEKTNSQISLINNHNQIEYIRVVGGIKFLESVSFIKKYNNSVYILANINRKGNNNILFLNYDYTNNNINFDKTFSIETEQNDNTTSADLDANNNIIFTALTSFNNTNSMIYGSVGIRKKNWVKIVKHNSINYPLIPNKIKSKNNYSIICGDYNDKFFLKKIYNNGTSLWNKTSNLRGTCHDIQIDEKENIIVGGSIDNRASFIVLDKNANLKKPYSFNNDNCTIDTFSGSENNYIVFIGTCFKGNNYYSIDGNISLNNFENYCFTKLVNLRFEDLPKDFYSIDYKMKINNNPLLTIPSSPDVSLSLYPLNTNTICELEDIVPINSFNTSTSIEIKKSHEFSFTILILAVVLVLAMLCLCVLGITQNKEIEKIIKTKKKRKIKKKETSLSETSKTFEDMTETNTKEEEVENNSMFKAFTTTSLNSYDNPDKVNLNKKKEHNYQMNELIDRSIKSFMTSYNTARNEGKNDNGSNNNKQIFFGKFKRSASQSISQDNENSYTDSYSKVNTYANYNTEKESGADTVYKIPQLKRISSKLYMYNRNSCEESESRQNCNKGIPSEFEENVTDESNDKIVTQPISLKRENSKAEAHEVFPKASQKRNESHSPESKKIDDSSDKSENLASSSSEKATDNKKLDSID